MSYYLISASLPFSQGKSVLRFRERTMKILTVVLVLLLLFVGCAPRQGALRAGESISSETDIPVAPAVPLEIGIDRVAQEISESLGSEQRPKIAVVDLLGPCDNHSQLGSFISEKLITKLFLSGRFEKVLERRLLRHLLVQQRIEMEEYFNQDTVRSVCEKIGIDAMVMGFVTDRGSRVDVNVRLINTQGEILSVGETQIDKDLVTSGMLEATKKASLTVAINPSHVNASVALGEAVVRSINGIALFRRIPQGNRSIIVTARGYEPVQESIYLNDDRTLTVRMVPRRATLTLTIDPPQAEIVFDGEDKGEASDGMMVLRDVPVGKHTILITSKGYLPDTREIELYEERAISIKLLSDSRRAPQEAGYPKKGGLRDEKPKRVIHKENEKSRHSQTGIWEVEDEQGNRSTLYQTGDGDDAPERNRVEQEKQDRAWEMLRNLDLIIDTRERE